MQHLADSCHEFRQSLVRLYGICQRIQDNMEQFDKVIESYAFEKLTRRLYILSSWILAWAKSLYIEHQGQGYVTVFLREGRGITILWVETEDLVSDKAYYEAGGSMVFSVDEATSIINGMMSQLGPGNWAEVVDWVYKYGRSPGLDFSKIS